MDKNILWLASWYPTVLSPFEGDFIQRHAKAVSLYTKITVIHIKKDEHSVVTKNVKEIITVNNGLTEILVFYQCYKTGFRLFDKILSAIKYKVVYRTVLNKYIISNGVPDLIHLHVALKAGIQALWLKKRFNILYLLSEHWSGFLEQNGSGINSLNYVQKNLLKKIFSEAERLTVVSDTLGKGILNFFCLRYKIVPNVVDTSIFFPVESPVNNIPEFIHVSSLNYEKNIEDIIEAFYLIKQKNIPFHLIIYGPEKKDLQHLVKQKNIADNILFKHEEPQTLLSEDVKKADALILYSRYETFGCVVIEANACGIPAILSNLPVFREYSIENNTAVFASPNNAEDLADAITNFISKRNLFSKSFISDYTKSKFSYEIVGKQFIEIYKSILG